jgi:hypothetical protein
MIQDLGLEKLRKVTKGGFITISAAADDGETIVWGMEIPIPMDKTPVDVVHEFADCIAAGGEIAMNHRAAQVTVWYTSHIGAEPRRLWLLDARKAPKEATEWLPAHDTPPTTT